MDLQANRELLVGEYEGVLSATHAKLHALASAPKDVRLLRELQGDLLAAITSVEKRIREVRAAAGGLRSVADGLLWIRQQLRQIGDGLLYLYLSPIKIRHLSYGQDAGFIEGKAGTAHELAVLDIVIGLGKVGILCDLTTKARFGDIVAVGDAGQPVLLEAKGNRASRDANARRQLKRIQDLLSFEIDGRTSSAIPKELRDAGYSTLITVRGGASGEATNDSWEDAIPRVVAAAVREGVAIEGVSQCIHLLGHHHTQSFGRDLAAPLNLEWARAQQLVWQWTLLSDSPEPIAVRPVALALPVTSTYIEFLAGRLLLFSLLNKAQATASLEQSGIGIEFLADSEVAVARSWLLSHPGHVAEVHAGAFAPCLLGGQHWQQACAGFRAALGAGRFFEAPG